MSDTLYPHNAQLYDRRFMNCAERHALVFLKERRPEVDMLFYRALVSSDAIFEQIIQNKSPKYNFLSGCFGNEDMVALGITVQHLHSARFAEIKPQINKILTSSGFALISGSVFYFEHCPEFRSRHLHHLVVLNGYDASRDSYGVVDDNPASVLCSYEYPAQQVADFYENNGDRLVRYYTLERYDEAVAAARFDDAFKRHIDTYTDSQQFFTRLTEFMTQSFESQDRKLKLLHDAFSLLSGSRSLFGHYLETRGHPTQWVELARTIGQAAFILKSLVVKARITQRIDLKAITDRVEQLGQLEQQLLAGITDLLQRPEDEHIKFA